MKELERIKEEKAAAAAKKEREQRELADQINRESALKSNPLVSVGLSGDALSAKVLPSSHRKHIYGTTTTILLYWMPLYSAGEAAVER